MAFPSPFYILAATGTVLIIVMLSCQRRNGGKEVAGVVVHVVLGS